MNISQTKSILPFILDRLKLNFWVISIWDKVSQLSKYLWGLSRGFGEQRNMPIYFREQGNTGKYFKGTRE